MKNINRLSTSLSLSLYIQLDRACNTLSSRYDNKGGSTIGGTWTNLHNYNNENQMVAEISQGASLS